MTASSGEVSGTIAVRPVRIGLAMKPTIDNVVRAVEHATSSWGGMYFPMLPVDDVARAQRLARAFALDVIVAVDETEASKELEELPGFRWRGRSPYGPLDPPRDGVRTRVLDASILIEATRAAGNRFGLVNPQWERADPFDVLYAAWFGQYGASDYGRKLGGEFGQLAEEVTITPEGSVPFLEDQLTPLGLTSFGVSCTSLEQGIAFFLLDLAEPNDLISFWNARAEGRDIFPWPLRTDDRLADAAAQWLDYALAAGRVLRARKGTGEEGPLEVRILSARDRELPSVLASLLDARGIEPWPSVADAHPFGWRGRHPFETDFKASFTSTVDEEQFAIEIPVPRIDFLPRRREPFSSGVVAAHVEIYAERGITPGFVVALPNVRLLSFLLKDYAESSEHFQRGTGDGRIAGVSADLERLKLPLISAFSIFETLLSDSGWECTQTDDGRLTGRLIELLGGPASHVANQPAVREVLTAAAGTHRGKPIAALVADARSHQGSWPDPISRPEQRRHYPERVVNHLLARKLLRPALPVRCPRCTTETGWSPDDLSSVLTCPMCDEHFPLGLALSLARKRVDWLYRLAGNISSPKLAETFPIMAALAVLAQYRSFSAASLPHVLGMRIDAPGQQREVDILAVLDDGGLPIVIAGEAKSYRDDIDRRDLETLVRLQKYFHSIRLEAFVLVATLRESFEGAARQALRDVCEQAPDTLHYTHGERLALPITLVGRDLSAHPWADEHPTKWVRPPYTVADFAMQTCRRNLGLEKVEYVRSGTGHETRLTWR